MFADIPLKIFSVSCKLCKFLVGMLGDGVSIRARQLICHKSSLEEMALQVCLTIRRDIHAR